MHSVDPVRFALCDIRPVSIHPPGGSPSDSLCLFLTWRILNRIVYELVEATKAFWAEP